MTDLSLTWKAVEADTHEAKADALAFASDGIHSVIEAVDPLSRQTLTAALQALNAEKAKHEKEAKLLRA